MSNLNTTPMKTPTEQYFHGIDFACFKKNEGNCFLRDDGKALHVEFVKPPESVVVKTAVDCPFGTTAEFLAVLSGKLPKKLGDDSLASRATERWLRSHVKNKYQSVDLWDDEAKAKYPDRKHYFHTTTHVQPTVALRIVPKFLHWLLQERERSYPSKPVLEFFHELRKGDGEIVESHPRMFLYSAIEKQHRWQKGSVSREVLYKVASYKGKGVKPEGCRRDVYTFLRQQTEWLQPHSRQLMPVIPPEDIIENDHAFDAFLSALTAWAHHRDLTIRWHKATFPLKKKAALLKEKAILQEGHILVLAEEVKTNA